VVVVVDLLPELLPMGLLLIPQGGEELEELEEQLSQEVVPEEQEEPTRTE
jgi:hypothetical protein